MKILIDVTSTQDQFANRGIGRFTREVVSRIIKQSAQEQRDDKFFLLTFNSPTTLQDTISKYPDRVSSENIGKLRLSDKFNTIWWRRQYLPAIKRIIANEKPDVYYTPYFWRFAPYKILPSFVSIHDLAFPILGKYSTAPRYLDWIRKMQYHHALNKVGKAAGVIADSENTKSDLLKYVKMDPNKVHSVALGISDDVHEIELDADILMKYLPLSVIERGYILYYGGVEPNKNVKQVVKSYAALKKAWREDHQDMDKLPYLVLAGGDFTKLDMGNSVLADIRYTIDDEDITDDVYFTGFFEDEDMNDLLSHARLFIHLSLYEGFGLAALEAMKCKTPVVASNASCYPEVLGYGAVLVDPSDEEKVANEILDILKNPEKEKELSDKAYKRAMEFDWDKTADDIYKIFSKYIAEKDKENQ